MQLNETRTQMQEDLVLINAKIRSLQPLAADARTKTAKHNRTDSREDAEQTMLDEQEEGWVIVDRSINRRKQKGKLEEAQDKKRQEGNTHRSSTRYATLEEETNSAKESKNRSRQSTCMKEQKKWNSQQKGKGWLRDTGNTKRIQSDGRKRWNL